MRDYSRVLCLILSETVGQVPVAARERVSLGTKTLALTGDRKGSATGSCWDRVFVGQGKREARVNLAEEQDDRLTPAP